MRFIPISENVLFIITMDNPRTKKPGCSVIRYMYLQDPSPFELLLHELVQFQKSGAPYID